MGGFAEASHIPASSKTLGCLHLMEAGGLLHEMGLGVFRDWSAVQARLVGSLTFVEMRECGSTGEKMLLLSFYLSELVT
jgi:hypothetical protein